jgi:hypothetical protein
MSDDFVPVLIKSFSFTNSAISPKQINFYVGVIFYVTCLPFFATLSVVLSWHRGWAPKWFASRLKMNFLNLNTSSNLWMTERLKDPLVNPLYSRHIYFCLRFWKVLSLHIVATNTAKSFPELQRSLSSSAVKIPGGSPRSPTMRLQPRLRQKRPRIDTSQGGWRASA